MIDFTSLFLKWLAPVAVVMAQIRWLELDLDLFVYELFTWEVSHSENPVLKFIKFIYKDFSIEIIASFCEIRIKKVDISYNFR